MEDIARQHDREEQARSEEDEEEPAEAAFARDGTRRRLAGSFSRNRVHTAGVASSAYAATAPLPMGRARYQQRHIARGRAAALLLLSRNYGEVPQHQRDHLLPGRTDQERPRPSHPHQSLPPAERPGERASGRQEPAEDRRPDRLRKKRAAAERDKLAARPLLHPHQLLQKPARQVLSK